MHDFPQDNAFEPAKAPPFTWGYAVDTPRFFFVCGFLLQRSLAARSPIR